MIETQKAIYEFHKKHKFPINLPLKPNKGLSKIIMIVLCKMLRSTSKLCFLYWKHTGKTNESFYRFHLMAEELAELMLHINKGEVLGTCDGLGDLLYVVIGTAVAYRLPAKEVSDEVCRSNETKAPRDPKNNTRLRNKGKDFSPPDFMLVLAKGRQRLRKEKQC
jgi:hypothetical protein